MLCDNLFELVIWAPPLLQQQRRRRQRCFWGAKRVIRSVSVCVCKGERARVFNQGRAGSTFTLLDATEGEGCELGHPRVHRQRADLSKNHFFYCVLVFYVWELQIIE
jgi:hypothetical protein